VKKYWRIGEPYVWGTAAALSVTLLIAFTLIVVVMTNGLGVFWPSDLLQIELKDGKRLLGELIEREPRFEEGGDRLQLKVANRDLYGLDFRWIDEADIASIDRPDDAIALEREEYGNFYGFLDRVDTVGFISAGVGRDEYETLEKLFDVISGMKEELDKQRDETAELSYKAEMLRKKERKLAFEGVPHDDPTYVGLQREEEKLSDLFREKVANQAAAEQNMRRARALFRDASGREKEMAVADIVRLYRPNAMGVIDKSLFYGEKLVELFVGEPRESNTEGGLFPAIFGTVMLIFIMSLFSFPLGVVAAIYLREYAHEGIVVRLVRIAVNNLAGIPSIVYGIFGLGFFVYGIGSSIDAIFFPERLPTPTFGTGGILWASMTLALLTVPVVIVSTEEALGAIPREMREGSLALGATKFQTLVRILVPMASPGIMTGLILAMARAAGEVAPLMITGVVKLAPALPVDGHFPFLHLDRKFMHLGFHIFDIGFQSPNVEAAKPMVFITTLLLVLIVLTMSGIAIYLRNKMKKRYTFGTF